MHAFVETAHSWHGGQWSALYSFASTGGTVHDEDHRTELLREIEHDITWCNTEVGTMWKGGGMNRPEVFTQALADEYRPEVPKLEALKTHVASAELGEPLEFINYP